jgi:(2S)-methylsuccinyl-CoA dehydrogenase
MPAPSPPDAEPTAAAAGPADLAAATAAVDVAAAVVAQACRHLAGSGPVAVDEHQVVAYDLAHAAATVEAGRAMVAYGAAGEVEARLACAYVADAVGELAAKLFGREAGWGVGPDALDAARAFTATYRHPAFLASLADRPGPSHLDPDLELARDTFRRFADERIAPVAERIHRRNEDIPEEIIAGLAEMGGFGLSVPEAYGGWSAGGAEEYLAMVVATEELSRGSLGAGGSLITRPEILTRALLAGGTEEQKQRWLPKLATTEAMAAVAVTEPDFGSDVAGVSVTATPTEGGWLVNGTKTWCTFGARANTLMLLARTDPDRSKAHRGLSLFVVPKPVTDGEGFALTPPAGGGGG